jgi:hypothetical protein
MNTKTLALIAAVLLAILPYLNFAQAVKPGKTGDWNSYRQNSELININPTSDSFPNLLSQPTARKANFEKNQRKILTKFPISKQLDAVVASGVDNKYKYEFEYNTGNRITTYTVFTDNSGSWNNSERFTYAYNPAGNVVNEKYEIGSGEDWVNSYQNLYVYNQDNKLLNQTYQKWDGSQWVNYSLYSYSYNFQGNLIQSFYDLWDGSAWAHSTGVIQVHNAGGYLVSTIHQNAENGQLVDYDRYTYTYDDRNNRAGMLYERLANKEWVYFTQHVYSYNSQDYITSDLTQTWENAQWKIQGKITYEYSNSYLTIETIGWGWNGSEWVLGQGPALSYKQIDTYDWQGNLITAISQTWGRNDTAWNNYVRQTYSYTLTSLFLSEYYDNWESGQWVQKARNVWSYDKDDNLNNIKSENLLNSQWTMSDNYFFPFDSFGNGYWFFGGDINFYYNSATTFVISNEAPGYLIDHLIAAGLGNSSLYEVLVALKPSSGGVISDEFLDKLASCPAGSEIFTATLSDVTPPANNPVGINTDGTLIVVPIYGTNYFQHEGWDTYTGNQSGIGIELFTFATSPQYYIDGGSSNIPGGPPYQAFAIAWSNSTDGIPDAVTSLGAPYAYPNPFTHGFYIHNLPDKTQVEIFNIHGKLVYKTEPTDNKMVQPGKLSDGIYFLKLINSQGARYQKIVKY